MRKIVNITIFAITGLAVILAVFFMLGFNQDTKDKYKNIVEVKTNNPQMLNDLQIATIETLPAFISKYEEDLAARNANLKNVKKQRDIFYTFIYHLGNLAHQEALDQFKNGFSNYTKSLFGQAEKKEYFVSGFSAVKTYDEYLRYFDKLKIDYQAVNQSYLMQVSAVKAETGLLKQIQDINAAISTVKKQYDLTELQKNVKTFKSESGYFNFTLILSYLLFFVTCAIMLIFLLWHTFGNMRNNMGLLIGIGILVLLVIVGYLTASDELSAVAIKQKAEPNTVRWIGAGLFTAYSMFLATIAVIVITMIINSLKKAK
jgi:hypothetical protein